MERTYSPNTLRNFIQNCIDKQIVITSHNRAWGWEEENCIRYMNNAFRDKPRLGHTLSVYLNYSAKKTIDVNFYTHAEEVDVSKLEEETESSETISSEDIIIMKDGRHKTQLYIWLCTGSKLDFGDGVFKRYYRGYNISRSENSRLEGIDRDGLNPIYLLDNDEEIFIDLENDKIYVLYKIIDDIIFNNKNYQQSKSVIESIMNPSKQDERIICQTIAGLIIDEKSNVLYDRFNPDQIAFQREDVSGMSDHEISIGIRDIQRGKMWTTIM
jgi:hypothetical protein